MNPPVPQFTRVNLITGFLGSGKTTLLQRLLADPALADTAVLINEFGEIGLDHHLLERIDDRMVLLQSGCLCCTIRGELSDAMRDLHSRRARGVVPPFQRLVIESTGLADPFPVLTTIHADPVLKHHFRPGHVIVTVDAVNWALQRDRQPEWIRQVAVADRIVVTKTDLADPAPLLACLRAINPAPILLAADQTPSAAILLDDGAFDPLLKGRFDDDAEDHGHGPNRHGADIHAFALTFEGKLDWTSFGIWLTMLLNRHGGDVLRVKGILDVAGSDAPVAIHGVQHLVHAPTHMRAWPDHSRQSRIVFIVRGLDRTAIEQSLSVFLARDVAARPVAA